MPHRWRARLLGAAILCWTQAAPAWAVPAIMVTGGWSPTIGVGQLQGGAGTDLVPSIESPANQVVIDLTGLANDSDAWRVDVRRTDINWPGAFVLQVQRTSDGMGTGSIQSGGSYLTITESDQAFFDGAGDRTQIEAQLRLSGISLQVPPGGYSTTVTYTLVDT